MASHPLPFLRKLTVVTLALALAACTISVAADTDRSFERRFVTPPLVGVQDADGYAEIRVDGFRTHKAAVGAPDVPTRTVLVAIPPGATPRLEVRLPGARGFRNLVPRPVPRTVVDFGAFGEDGPWSRADRDPLGLADRLLERRFEAVTEHYAGEGTFPAQVAWLGATGVVRDQRYVELHLAPVRYDRALGGLLIDTALDVTVHFDGADEGDGVPREADPFEAVYRSAFVNYAQGRSFRVRSSDRLPKPATPRQATAGATGPVRRIRVSENGPVRLDHALFLAQAPEYLDTDPNDWQLMNRGQQVPIHIHQIDSPPGDDTRLEANEWIQFYGQAVDDEPRTVLNYDNPTVPSRNLHAVKDFTDENAYFLTTEATGSTMTPVDATPPPAGTAEPLFLSTARYEEEEHFWPVPGEVWFALPFVNQASGAVSEEISLPGLASGTAPLQVRMRVRGFLDCFDGDPDKKTGVSLKNDLGDTLELPVGNQNVGEFDGNSLYTHDFGWTHSGTDPVATDPLHVLIEMLDVPPPCAQKNEVLRDFIEVDYERLFVADGDRLEFEYADGNRLFEITGFTSGSVEVYEITETLGNSSVIDAKRLVGVEVGPDGQGGVMARFEIDDNGTGAPRRFVAAGHGNIPVPSAFDFEADRVSTLLTDDTPADLVVIAHPDLINSVCSEGANPCSYDVDCTASDTDRCEVTTGSRLDLLMARRAMQGISSRVVRVRDVEDEFNFGLAGPEAIQNMLAWLLAGGWQGDPPAWVLLLGDGSYDYKAGTAQGNFVSTQLMVKAGEAAASSIIPYYVSDNLLAAVEGDDHIADLMIGRLSARTFDQLHFILGKILFHEENSPDGPWRSSVLLISDRGANDDFDGTEAGGFEAMNDASADFLLGTNYDSTHLRYWTDNCQGGPIANCDPGLMKLEIVNRVNGFVGNGVAMVQFAGHGHFDLWSNDVFFCANEQNNNCDNDDTAMLSNFDRLPWLIVHNCLTGGFHTPEAKSMGEQWLKWLSGGAFAVYAPSGLSFQFIGNAVINSAWNDVFGDHKERMVGVPVINSQVALCGQDSVEPCQNYVLLGDPTSKLGLPDIKPPTNVVATASTGVVPSVTLTWDTSTSSDVTYDVYRRQEMLDVHYSLLNVDDPIEETTYTDSAVDHTRTYFYYVVARSADGFDSAVSNFNTECIDQAIGDDCLHATPLNLVTPATPTGVAAIDAETGGAILVSWNFNPEGDIAKYVVHFGTTESLGGTWNVLPSQNQQVLSGLQDGIPHYVAVQAINSSGTESLLSVPSVVATPNLVLGVKSPGFIDDLVLGKSGPNADLSWGAVTTDIYGKPITVNEYEIFRGTDALFVPAPGNRIGTTPETTFTDPGALGDGTDYHYLVRALDGDGNPGGLGRQLPQGIVDLELQLSDVTPGAIFLSWPLVSTDFDGNPSAISHYEVWSWSGPFTRADVEAELPDLIVPAASGPLVEIVPLGPDRYYSVLAVDTRGNRSPF